MSQLTRIVTFPLQLAGAVVRIPAAIEAVIRLNEIVATMGLIRANTEVLGEVRTALLEVADHTEDLDGVFAATTSIQRATSTIVDQMPELSGLGTSLPPALENLGDLTLTIQRLEARLQTLEGALAELSVAVTPLGNATQRLRLAGKPRRAQLSQE